MALWNIVHISKAVSAEIYPDPILSLIDHKLDSNANPKVLPPTKEAQAVPCPCVIWLLSLFEVFDCECPGRNQYKQEK
mgnify:CR=1 FL=1